MTSLRLLLALEVDPVSMCVIYGKSTESLLSLCQEKVCTVVITTV